MTLQYKVHILVIAAFTLVVNFSQGQKKYIDYVKTLSYQNAYSNTDSSLTYLETVRFERDSTNLQHSKEISYDVKSTPWSYSLYYYHAFDEELEIHWSPNALSVKHILTDTTQSVSYEISLKSVIDVVKEASISNYRSGIINTLYVQNVDSIAAYYERWIKEDIGKKGVLKPPTIFRSDNLVIKKVRWEKTAKLTKGDTLISTRYHIDTISSSGSHVRDSTFIRQRKLVSTNVNRITKKYTEYLSPTKREIVRIEHDTINNWTQQRWYKKEINKTLPYTEDIFFDINIETYLENGNFESKYKILGNHPDEWTVDRIKHDYNSYTRKVIDTIASREIHIIRDSTGFIREGTANGITRKGDTLNFRMHLEDVGKKFLFIDRNIGVGINEYHISYDLLNNTRYRNTDRYFPLVSLYPNIDRCPLTSFKRIHTDGVMYRSNNSGIKKYRKPRKIKKQKLATKTSKSIRKRSKRMKSENPKVKVWKKKSRFNHIIYEVHFNK